MADPDYQRLWTDCTQALEDARQKIDDLKKDITWMDEDGDVGDELVSDVVADNKRLKAELAEAKLVAMQILATQNTDEGDAALNDLECYYNMSELMAEEWLANHKEEAKP